MVFVSNAQRQRSPRSVINAGIIITVLKPGSLAEPGVLVVADGVIPLKGAKRRGDHRFGSPHLHFVAGLQVQTCRQFVGQPHSVKGTDSRGVAVILVAAIVSP